MSTCGEMTCEPKRVRSPYLEPRLLGLDVPVKGDVHHPTGCRVEIGRFRARSVIRADRLERRVEDAKPGLLRVLYSRCHPDLGAVRPEGDGSEE